MPQEDVPLDDMPPVDPGFDLDAGDDLDGEEAPALPDALAGRVTPERWEAMDPEDRALVLDVHQRSESAQVEQLARALTQAQPAPQPAQPEPDKPARIDVGQFRDHSDEDLAKALANGFAAQQRVLTATDDEGREQALEDLRAADPNMMVQIMRDMVLRAEHRAEQRANETYAKRDEERATAQRAETRLSKSIVSACGHDDGVLREGHPVRDRAEKILNEIDRQTGGRPQDRTPQVVYAAFRQAYGEVGRGSRRQRNPRDARIQDVARQSAGRKRAFDKARRSGNEAEANSIAISQMLADPRFD